MNRDDLLVWLRSFICGLLRCGDPGDLSAVIEDISRGHPDRMRSVIALNAERYPDCDAHGLDLTGRRYQPERLLQGLRLRLQRHAGLAESVFCAANWPPTVRVSHG